MSRAISAEGHLLAKRAAGEEAVPFRFGQRLLARAGFGVPGSARTSADPGRQTRSLVLVLLRRPVAPLGPDRVWLGVSAGHAFRRPWGARFYRRTSGQNRRRTPARPRSAKDPKRIASAYTHHRKTHPDRARERGGPTDEHTLRLADGRELHNLST